MMVDKNMLFSSCRAGELNMSTALSLTAYLNQEREYVPWSSALSHLAFIGSMLSMEPSYMYYRVSTGSVMLTDHHTKVPY